MKLLLLADKESRYLWDFYKPGCLREYDLMLSCGDLKAEYLTFLATLGRSPCSTSGETMTTTTNRARRRAASASKTSS